MWNHLDTQSGSDHRYEVLQLLSHHLGAADRAVENRLVDHAPEYWRLGVITDEECLTIQPRFYLRFISE